MGGYGMNGYGMGGFGGGFGFGWILMILVWVLVIAGIVALVKLLAGSFGAGGDIRGDSKALAILKERFASGEIDEQEYQKRKRDLSQ